MPPDAMRLIAEIERKYSPVRTEIEEGRSGDFLINVWYRSLFFAIERRSSQYGINKINDPAEGFRQSYDYVFEDVNDVIDSLDTIMGLPTT